MVQLLLLYFFNIKPSHGYEIQRFIQLNHMDEWTNIKSGSIYYALNKLEKDQSIKMIKKIGQLEKSKRVYAITDHGKKALKTLAKKELAKNINGIQSEKFLLYPILASLSQEEIEWGIKGHIEKLEEELKGIKAWSDKKQASSFAVEQATFKLMEETVLNQINWHQVLLDHLDEALVETDKVSNYIKTTSFVD